MQVVVASAFPFPRLVRPALIALVSVSACVPVATAADNLLSINPALIASLELRAKQAAPREQVQLYADLVDKLSLLVGKELQAGDDEQAQDALRQFETCAAELETGLQRDSKNLKRTELLLHMTHRRLADMVRNASGEMKPLVQNAVSRLDHVQSALLSAVFEH